ncbi:MAG: adenine phosphoribosyltransferase [Alphaproteobacteria bacterium]
MADQDFDLGAHIRRIPDFPKPGIGFYDISTLLAHPRAWRVAVDRLAALVAPYEPAMLAGIESRGFLVAAPLALELGCGFMMVRKRGKLPGDVVVHDYDLEYGTDTIEVQQDAVAPGKTVVVLDDLIATGGTLAAAVTLIEKIGGRVAAAATIMELSFLDGRRSIGKPFHSLLQYED